MIAPGKRGRRCRRPNGARRWTAPAFALGTLLGLAGFPLAAAGAASSPPPLPPPPPYFQPVAMHQVSLLDPAVIVTPGQDAPDPFVLRTKGMYLMFSSQTSFLSPNVPLEASTTLTEFEGPAIDAMPTLPPWAEAGFTWGPDVVKVGHRYLLWFSAALASSGSVGTKCIGVAASANPAGPYVSRATAPLVCQLDHLGSIDPRVFVDPAGRLWLVWKSDDNADVNGDTHTTIWVQQLRPNGLSVLGQPVALLTADLAWEGRIVESPQMVFAGGHYWLFFSGNWFNQPDYAIGVAECAGPEGICEPTTLGPWLSANAQGWGPGEESLFQDGTGWWMLYAPYSVDFKFATPRPAAMVRLDFSPAGPAVVAPGTRLWSVTDPPEAKAHAPVATRPSCRGSGARCSETPPTWTGR